MHVGDICIRSVVTCTPSTSALTVAELMRDQHTTDVIVAETSGARRMPKGIVTFRDMVVRVVAARLDAASILDQFARQ